MNLTRLILISVALLVVYGIYLSSDVTLYGVPSLFVILGESSNRIVLSQSADGTSIGLLKVGALLQNTTTKGSVIDGKNHIGARERQIELQQGRNETQIKRSNATLPEWMDKYLDWHSKERRSLSLRLQLHASNNSTAHTGSNSTTKYLVVRCLKGDKCGGVSDRFKPLAFYVLLAAHTNRVLLLYWEKPTQLEYYLQPSSTGGISLDWRVNGTDVTLDEIRNKKAIYNGSNDRKGENRYGCSSMSSCVQKLNTEDRWRSLRVINVLLYGGNAISKAGELFNRWSGDKLVPKNRDIMKDIFRVFFEPTPTVANAISTEMKQLGLVEREFSTVHVRAKAPRQVPKDVFLGGSMSPKGQDANEHAAFVDMMGGVEFSGRTKAWLVGLFSNAIECAIQVSPSLPIYLASDTTEAVNYMVAKEKTNRNDPESLTRPAIVASRRENDTLHVDYDGNVGRPPSDFYHTFVDLFIMSKAKCISRGTGGFAVFAERIGEIDKDCSVMHREQNGDVNVCNSTSETIEI